MPLGRRGDQVQRKPVIGCLEHMECFSKRQVSQDIHGEVVTPVRHILGRRPPLCLSGRAATNLGGEGAHVTDDVALHLLHGRVGEAVGEDAALASVDVLVAGVVGVGRRVDKGVVELCLADVGAEAVDFLEGRGGVEGDRVGAEADDFALSVLVVLALLLTPDSSLLLILFCPLWQCLLAGSKAYEG